jgi:hypothetical protein
MQDRLMQVQAQPFLKLAQANMDLLTRFSTSPEVTGQAMASAANLFQQATEVTNKLMQSGAYAQLMQGMLQNYTQFLMELSHSGMDMMSSGQAALMQQVQEATENVSAASNVSHRRSRRGS